jgi:membrane protein implicated in regulation of membrane protease activity
MSALFWIWLAVAAIFLIVELSTPSLVFASFFAGALAAAAGALMHASYLWQGAIFAIVSILLIPLTRPLAARITKSPPQKTNIDALVDRAGIVTKMIDPDKDTGQVRVDGQVWQAVAPGIINAGEKIVVNKVRGARLYVTKLNK